jgi:hypothetical protein
MLRRDLRTTAFVATRVQLDFKFDCREGQEVYKEVCPVVKGECTGVSTSTVDKTLDFSTPLASSPEMQVTLAVLSVWAH